MTTPYLLTFASLLELLLGVLPDGLEQSVAHRAALTDGLGHHQRLLHKPREQIQDVVLLDAPSYTHLVYRPGVPLVGAVVMAGQTVLLELAD